MSTIRYHVTVTNPAALSNIDVIARRYPFLECPDGSYRGCVDVIARRYPLVDCSGGYYRGCVDVAAHDAEELEALFDLIPEVIEYSAENL